MKTGDKVRMTYSCKCDLMSNDCLHHVFEFGECVGIVEDIYYQNEDVCEWNVRWKPSNLRYAYNQNDLISLKEERKSKLQKLNETKPI